ncbi:hypothetical protein LOK49_LG07G01091 [Camellia lanceoleosa]|uniref:Uncharacterized protein n=1 Tax=Camellia lanceoleosa TaxID=1840588 RepID=A0ACC0H0H6_9ERIC|nr:hypothetical protein LOK49_LG07G01091 [Camellia lanceoleosa]
MEHGRAPVRRSEDIAGMKIHSTVASPQQDHDGEDTESERSVEEADLLERHHRKLKDPVGDNEVKHRSFKDALTQPFSMKDGSEPLDLEAAAIEVSNAETTIPIISLSKDEIDRIRDPWRSTLIVKLVGRNLGYNFFMSKLKSIWKPTSTFHGIDLGNHFYLIKFNEASDLNKVPSDGPWFVGSNFLSIRRVGECNGTTNKINPMESQPNPPPADGEPFGPWMLVQKRSKSSKKLEPASHSNVPSRKNGRWTDRDDSTRPNSHPGLVRQRDHEYVDKPISVSTITIPIASLIDDGCQLPVHFIYSCDGLSPPDHTVEPSDHSRLKPASKLSTADRGNFSPCPTPSNTGVHANRYDTLGVHPQGTSHSSNSGRTISEALTTTRYRRLLHNAKKQSIRTHDPAVSIPSLRRSLSSGARMDLSKGGSAKQGGVCTPSITTV